MTAILEARGQNGRVTFDGYYVTIYREGLFARASVGKGQKVIPVHLIGAVQWKPPGVLVNGYIQFSVQGEIAPKSQFGRQTVDAGKDENSVIITKGQAPAFERLRDAIQAAIRGARTMPPMPAPTPAPTAAERIQQLAQLRDQGLISPNEFEAKRAALVAEL